MFLDNDFQCFFIFFSISYFFQDLIFFILFNVAKPAAGAKVSDQKVLLIKLFSALSITSFLPSIAVKGIPLAIDFQKQLYLDKFYTSYDGLHISL